MAYKYQPIWDEIKKTHKAEVTVNTDYVPTVIQGVKKVKSRENVVNRSIGILTWPELSFKTEVISDHMTKITFEIQYDLRV